MGCYKQSFGVEPRVVEFITEHNGQKLSFIGESEDEVDAAYHKWLMIYDNEYAEKVKEELEEGLDIKYIQTENHRRGMTSLVGVSGSAPFSYGNYWSISLNGESYLDGYPVINMWAENYSVMKKKISNFIIVNGMCIINEPEIDKAYYIEDLFMKYNLHRGMSFTEKQMVRDWYGELRNE